MGKRANAVPHPSQPQLGSDQFYLPSTINIIKVDSVRDTPSDPVHTIEVNTDEEGQGCPLLGVYDKMSSAVRPSSWVAAYHRFRNPAMGYGNKDERASEA